MAKPNQTKSTVSWREERTRKRAKHNRQNEGCEVQRKLKSSTCRTAAGLRGCKAQPEGQGEERRRKPGDRKRLVLDTCNYAQLISFFFFFLICSTSLSFFLSFSFSLSLYICGSPYTLVQDCEMERERELAVACCILDFPQHKHKLNYKLHRTTKQSNTCSGLDCTSTHTHTRAHARSFAPPAPVRARARPQHTHRDDRRKCVRHAPARVSSAERE